MYRYIKYTKLRKRCGEKEETCLLRKGQFHFEEFFVLIILKSRESERETRYFDDNHNAETKCMTFRIMMPANAQVLSEIAEFPKYTQ